MALPDGMKIDLMDNGAPRECVDFTRRSIDTLGDGYAFSMNKKDQKH